MQAKPRYLIDDNNRMLLVNDEETNFINGSFLINEDNYLIYRLDEAVSSQLNYQLPEELVFTGSWKLNSDYDLQLELTQGEPEAGKKILTLKGEIVSSENDKLVFQLKPIEKDGSTSFQLLQLNGTWKVDELNQISFMVGKQDLPDIFTLKGAWQLDENQQIVYDYQKTDLKTKNKILSKITFVGFWQIASENRLTYILSRGTNAKFDFKVQIETPNVYPKEGVIKYRLGVGLKETTPGEQKIICLYGTWKVSRQVGLTFDMEYAKGHIQSLVFAANVNFDKNNQIVFNLKNKSDENLGLSVVFTHKFLKELDGELFLRLKRYRQDSGIDAGIRIPFN